ncbi:MAG: DUF2141 domain-containing protein [Pseudomonadota bacterium]
MRYPTHQNFRLKAGIVASLIIAAAACTTTPRGEAVSDQPETATLAFSLKMDVAEGAVMIALYGSAEAYDGGGEPVRAVRVPVEGVSMRATFTDLEPGQYAARAFHDLNGDGDLNTNPMGRPIEPFAFSNGAQAQFGPPSFADAAIDVPAGETSGVLDFRR